MKRVVVFLMAVLLVLNLAACGSQAGTEEETVTPAAEAGESVSATEGTEEEGTVVFTNPGEYTTTVAGRNGDIVVTAAFSDREILSIVVDSVETDTIGKTAMNDLVDIILTNQSLAVDVVAGATMSTEPFIQAMNELAAQAGGDSEVLSQAIQETAISYVTEADVIVVGAGAAGMTAALTAAQEGASVILLEKSNKVGGNTAPAQSGINAAGSALQEAAEVDFSVEDYIAMQTNDLVVPELVQALAEHSGETIDWLVANGADLTVSETKGYQLVAADSSQLTTGVLLNTVKNGVDQAGVNLYFNMDVTTLIQDEDGAVVGVIAEEENGEQVSFSGTAIVLATGGFGQDYERVITYRPDYVNCWTDEVAPTVGEGIDMAVAVGAATKDLDQIMLFGQVVIDYGMLNSTYGPGGRTVDGIYVNENAERFMAEKFGSTADILAQPDGIVTIVFNEEAKEGAVIDGLISSGVLYSAETPEELADQLGLDAETLAATISRWNEMVENGVDEDFGRETNLNLLEGTLYAYQFKAGVHYCMGGVLIDETAAVLNTDGEAITGLYAAGEVTGGVHGDTRVDGSAVADSFIFGHIAGATAAEYALNK